MIADPRLLDALSLLGKIETSAKSIMIQTKRVYEAVANQMETISCRAPLATRDEGTAHDRLAQGLARPRVPQPRPYNLLTS